MKKSVFTVIAVLAVLAAVIVSAGCTGQETEDDPLGDIDFAELDTAAILYYEMTGTTFNIGDTSGILLPANPAKGIIWTITGDDGLAVEETEFLTADMDIPVSTGAQSFIITFLTEGTHTIEVENTLDKKYTVELVAVQEDAEPMELRSILSLAPMVPHLAYPGDAYEIYFHGNPEKGQTWTVQDSEGLLISPAEFVADEVCEDGDEGCGLYMWKITALNPGSYTLNLFSEERNKTIDLHFVFVPEP